MPLQFVMLHQHSFIHVVRQDALKHDGEFLHERANFVMDFRVRRIDDVIDGFAHLHRAAAAVYMGVHLVEDHFIGFGVVRRRAERRMVTAGRDVGRKIAGRDIRDIDVERLHFHAKRFGDQLKCAFRGRIHAAVRQTHIARDGRDVDNQAGFLGAHVRQHGFHHLDRAKKIRLEIGLDLCRRDFFQRAGNAHAGVVHQHIDAA